MNKIFYYILLICLLSGCSTGIKPLKNSQLQGYYGKPQESIIYTNTVQLVKPESEQKISVEIPITITKPLKDGLNSNILDDIKITVPKEIIFKIIIPNSTNTVQLSGATSGKSIWLSPAIFLYFFVLVVAVWWGIYMWNRRKPKNLKARNYK